MERGFFHKKGRKASLLNMALIAVNVLCIRRTRLNRHFSSGGYPINPRIRIAGHFPQSDQAFACKRPEPRRYYFEASLSALCPAALRTAGPTFFKLTQIPKQSR